MTRMALYPILCTIVGLLGLIPLATAEKQSNCAVSEDSLTSILLPNEQKEEVIAEIKAAALRQEPRGTRLAFCNLVQESVKEIGRRGLRVSAQRFMQQGIHFEEFRIDTFISSGVAPKKYFGFLDLMGDTAEFEKIMLDTIAEAVTILLDYCRANHLGVTVSEREILVTFLAEGGALLLTSPEDSPDRVHPVRGIGLDDFRIGFRRFPDLVTSLDKRFGTRLEYLILDVAGVEVLTRPMTFREAILGTAIMYLYEKELALRLMRQKWQIDLEQLPIEKQFVATSLVYNSGIAFEPNRIEQITQFTTGTYLDAVSKGSARPLLPVLAPEEALSHLATSGKIPQQLTSWSAVYHILQRYGAWVGIERFHQP